MSRLAVAVCVSVAVFLAPSFTFALTPPSLEAARLSSRAGTSQTILRITDTGRYSLTAQSATGSTVEIIDRMAGRIASASSPSGVSDSTGRTARIDAYLEPGEYKVQVTHAAAETVTLQARAFAASNAGADGSAVPILGEGETSRGELGDLQLFQYWVTMDADHPTLLLEAWGRNLVDVAVWKDGVWDTGLRAEGSFMELEPGKPLAVLELNARLEPGAYLVTCAGGPRAAWAKDTTAESAAEPFFVTRGARFLGEMGRMSLTLPATGTTSFLVSGTVSRVEMQVRSARAYRLMLSGNLPGRGRYAGARQAAITGKSSSLRCSVNGTMSAPTSWVTVQGPAGETVEVAWMGASVGGALRPFPESGAYFTSVLSSMEGESSMDATGLVLEVRRERGKDVLETRALQTVALSPDHPVRRQVNSLGELSFILQPQKGTYSVVEKDRASASATYDFQLLDDQLFPRGAQPLHVTSGGRVDLLDKLYYVTISPVKPGVLDFAIVPTSFLGRARTGAVFSSPPPGPQADIVWPSTTITQSGSVATYLLLPPRRDVVQGFVARKLPLDLFQPLPVSVDAGRSLSFAFLLPREALLASTNAAFSPSTVTIDSAPWAPGRVYPAGLHTCAIRNTASLAQWHVVAAVEPEGPAQRTAQGSAGRPAAASPGLDALPALVEGAPAWRTFDREQVASFVLKVPAPGSYRVTTMGRLAMSLAIRTPLKEAFANAAENVDGRNAEIMAYLRPGTYMLQASARGYSAGRAGVLLQKLPLVAAGTLREGEVLRATVGEGELLEADVQVGADGEYVLECTGLGRAFPYRLEDDGGWPLGEPLGQGTVSRRMAAGTYHYVSMAARERTRRILAFRAAGPAATVDPNAKRVPLTLNQGVQKTWNESAGRPADVFTLALPAEVRGSLSLTAGMLFRLVDAQGAVPYQGIGGKSLQVTLHAGEWRMEVTSLLEDNQKRYQVSLSTEDLLAGTTQAVSSGREVIPVSVGAPGTIEIWSYGGNELDASLTDESGRLVSRGETIPDDWNFRVLAQVKPGRYLLHVSSPLFFPSAPVPQPAARPAAPQEMTEDEDAGDEDAGYEDGGDEDVEVSSDDSAYEDSEDSEEVYDDEDSEEEATVAPAVAPAQPSAAAQLSSGVSVIRLAVREERPVPPSSGTLAASVELMQEIAVAPFTTREAGVYRLAGQSAAPVSVAVFRDATLLASGPSPLRIALARERRYTLRFWSSTSQKAVTVALSAGPERAVDTATDGALDVRAPVLAVTYPAGTSVRVDADAGALLYAAGPETPFVPLVDSAVSSVAGTLWVVRPDGSAVGACRISTLTLGDGVTEGVTIGDSEGSFTLRVPARTAALVRTENAGRIAGLSASPSGARPAGGFDWRGALVDSNRSLLGLREGTFRGRLWSTDEPEGGQLRRVPVSARMFPINTEEALGRGEKAEKALSVPGGTAASLTLAGAQRVEVSLERGMVAFAWAPGPAGVVDASIESATGFLDAPGGSIVIVNLMAAAALATVREAAPAVPREVSEGSPWETARPAGAEVWLDTRQARSPSRLYVSGTVDSARLFSEEDGRVHEGTREDNAELGTLLAFPAQRGRLVIRSSSGPVRAWIAAPDQVLAAFAGRDSRAQQAGLPQEGGTLRPLPQAWTMTLSSDSFVSLRADGEGVLALFSQAGACLKAEASSGDRSLVAMLARGAYTVFTRPFADSGGQGGALTARVLSPRTLEADGPGPEALVGSRDAALYRFVVATKGRVGCGVRAGSETLTATLLDERFAAMDTGRIFVRTLAPGVYYLLVEANGQAQRYSPVVYGLRGNDAQIPDDVLSSYQGE